MPEVTQLLNAIEHGDPHAADQLLPLVYDELRRLASLRLAQEKPGQTLQATALVHEAYVRLVGQGAEEPYWDSRRHFFAAAAEAMRRILVENARRKKRLKRGGDRKRQEFEAASSASEPRDDLLALDEALNKLAATDRTSAQLIQLRYFAGMTLAQAATALGIAPRTADRVWAYARAWLYREIQGAGPEPDNS
jgi:RNA polymerase sigma factor (TIGR02999 family)